MGRRSKSRESWKRRRKWMRRRRKNRRGVEVAEEREREKKDVATVDSP